MAQQDSYSEMQDLLLALQSITDRLDNGKLSAEEVNEACETARQLYERWVVIRYKIFEGSPVTDADKKKENDTLLNQTSLIDAIQEAEVSVPKVLDMFSFEIDDASTIEEVSPIIESEPEPGEEPIEEESTEEPEEEPEIELPQVESEKEEEIETEEVESPEDIESPKEVIAKAKTEDAGSLAEKLEKSPIDNLKSAIGLNRKFQFINTLFDGDNEKYDASIKELNQDQSLEQAVNWVKSNVPQSFDDEDELAVLEAFIDLIERRHS